MLLPCSALTNALELLHENISVFRYVTRFHLYFAF